MTDRTTERVTARAGLSAGPSLVGELRGHGLFRMSPQDVPALRRRPGPIPVGWGNVPPSLLRYSDEQTIAGTAAVFAAIEEMGLPPEAFEGWGVVAASRYLGRANLSRALRDFLAEGVWSTSPHLIPHFALHSPSGTISLALGLHGPNLGVGGGLYAAAEGFLAALTWLSSGTVPGVWLVFSGWTPELIPDRFGRDHSAVECQAMALALARADGSQGRPVFVAVVGEASRPAASPLDLVMLDERLARGGESLPRAIATDAMGRLRIELVKGSDGPG